MHATAVHHEVLEPKMAHAQTHDFSHSQAVSYNYDLHVHKTTDPPLEIYIFTIETRNQISIFLAFDTKY